MVPKLTLTSRQSPSAKSQSVEPLVTEIYQSVLKDIISVQLVPGEIISEVTLARKFNTSRTPVREALIPLCNEDFLRKEPFRGYVVTELSLDTFQELMELRLILEPGAARLAAQNPLGAGNLKEAEQIQQKLEALVGQERTYQHFVEEDRLEYRFHVGIAEGSGNTRLAKFMAETMRQFRRFNYALSRSSSWDALTFEEHRNILAAICRGDAAQAERHMLDHLTRWKAGAMQMPLSAIMTRSS